MQLFLLDASLIMFCFWFHVFVLFGLMEDCCVADGIIPFSILGEGRVSSNPATHDYNGMGHDVNGEVNKETAGSENESKMSSLSHTCTSPGSCIPADGYYQTSTSIRTRKQIAIKCKTKAYLKKGLGITHRAEIKEGIHA